MSTTEALQALLDLHHQGRLTPLAGSEGYISSVIEQGEAALAAAAPSPADPWQPIATAPKDPRTRVLLKWVSGQSVWICIGAWDSVENRPSLKTKGCPREGWLPDGCTCIPVNQKDCVSFMSLPAAPGAQPAPSEPEPIDMVLHCPACGLQHIDAPDPMGETEGFIGAWINPPHRSHLCHGCGHIWRPADVATNGVLAVKTKGKNDSAQAEVPAEPSEQTGLRAAAEQALETLRTYVRTYNDYWERGMDILEPEGDAAVKRLAAALAAPPTGATENRIDRLESELAQARAAVPEGWSIKRDKDWIGYRRPDGWTQAVTPHEPQHAHSESLFMLLDAMLSASPVAPEAVTPSEPEANWTRDGIATFIADNWPDRKHTLAEIEAGIRAIEIRPPATASSADARDAARYRFIRDADRSDENLRFSTIVAFAMEGLDQAVDAAIAAGDQSHG